MPTPASDGEDEHAAERRQRRSAAPVAPAKPIWERAWPAKVWPRSTRK